MVFLLDSEKMYKIAVKTVQYSNSCSQWSC